jgi:hypothetical protein
VVKSPARRIVAARSHKGHKPSMAKNRGRVVRSAPKAVFHRSAPKVARTGRHAPSEVQVRNWQKLQAKNQNRIRSQRTNKNVTRSSIAFGGRTYNHQTNNSSYTYAPVEISRGWDRGHEHAWNHHHYRWHNNAWVIADFGWAGGSPVYDYSYSYPAAGYAPANGANLVQAVQNALDQQGYDAGTPDGAIGPQTRAAIAAYQRDNGLLVSGEINRATVLSLGI